MREWESIDLLRIARLEERQAKGLNCSWLPVRNGTFLKHLWALAPSLYSFSCAINRNFHLYQQRVFSVPQLNGLSNKREHNAVEIPSCETFFCSEGKKYLTQHVLNVADFLVLVLAVHILCQPILGVSRPPCHYLPNPPLLIRYYEKHFLTW